MTALHWSAYNGAAENVRLLLKAVRFNCRHGTFMISVCQGADIVVTDSDGKTALHWTANNPDDNTVKVILVF